MGVYGYLRVSTVAQADEGESLDVQKRQIKGYADMLGLKLDAIFVERAVSGAKPLEERRKGKQLLDTLRSGDVVIAAKLDRIFRSALDALSVCERLKEQGVSLHLIDLGGDVTGNGISKLFLTIMSAVAEAERDRIRERVATVKADQKKRGRYLGGDRPFGYQVSDIGELLEDKEEQKAIKRMQMLREHGASYRAIATELGQGGVSLTHMTVKRILER